MGKQNDADHRQAAANVADPFEELELLAKACSVFERTWRRWKADIVESAIQRQRGANWLHVRRANQSRSTMVAQIHVIEARIRGIIIPEERD